MPHTSTLTGCPCCASSETPSVYACSECNTDTTPAQRTINFAGLDDPVFESVDYNNRPWTVTQYDPFFGPCSFRDRFLTTIGYIEVYLFLFYNGVGVSLQFQGERIDFFKATSTPYNCLTETLGSIPYQSLSGYGELGFVSTVTCTVSL